MMDTRNKPFSSEDLKDNFIKLYDKYRNLMFYIAKDILKDDHLAEDAVQEAFINISKNLDKVREPVSSETRRFVSVIVRNVSLNMAMKRSHEIPVDDLSGEDHYFSRCYDSSQDEFFSRYSCEQIVEALKALPSSLKDPLILYVANGMSTKEIAQELNISLSAVHKRIQRGRQKILNELKEKGEDYEYLRK